MVLPQWSRSGACRVLCLGLRQRSELLCDGGPALLEAHRLVLVIGFPGPVACTAGVAGFSALIGELHCADHKWALRVPAGLERVGEDEALAERHLQEDAFVWHLLAVRPAHHDG